MYIIFGYLNKLLITHEDNIYLSYTLTYVRNLRHNTCLNPYRLHFTGWKTAHSAVTSGVATRPCDVTWFVALAVLLVCHPDVNNQNGGALGLLGAPL